MSDSTTEHMQGLSQKYLVLIKVLIISVPLGTALYWVFYNSLPEGFMLALPIQTITDLPALTRALALLVSMLPMSIAIYTLITLKVLFSLYAQGVIFSARNVTCFRRLGFALIAWVIATTLFTPLISGVLSYGAAAGKGVIVAKFGIEEVIMLIISGVVIVVSWAMNEGCKLKDEQALTI